MAVEFCRCCGAPMSGSALNSYGSDHCFDCYCEQFEERCPIVETVQLLLWAFEFVDMEYAAR